MLIKKAIELAKHWSLGLVFLLFISPIEALVSTPEQQRATREILEILDKRHFVNLTINNALSARFLDSYIKTLDPSKSFFLQADIDEFSQYKHRLDDELRKGENSAGFFIYNRLKQRMTSRLNKVIVDLQQNTSPIDFSVDEELIIDRDETQWPRTTKDADQLWRKRIKSFFLAQKLAGEAAEKTRKDLIKRYQRQLDRVNKNSAEDIYETYINAFTELYDPHTNYLSPRASENFSINMSLSLEGIGAVLQTEDEYTKVVRLIAAGPADKQGKLKPADRITGVAQGDDGEMVSVISWPLDEVVDLIRGPKDSVVRLEVVSSNTSNASSKVIRIKRDKVKLEDQAAQKATIKINDKGKTFTVGIINIPTFYLDFTAFRNRDPNYRSTTKDVYRLLGELEKEGVDGVVIDLRNNGGGSLYEATSVTDLFIDKGPVVQIGKDNGEKASDYSKNRAAYRGPLVVLINRLSASASEIFSGAIQDYKRGIVVGSQSFGKGTVQTLTRLKSQGEIKITESKFYRVSGESTQHRGVIPDILMPELIDVQEIGESSYDTALPWSKTTPVQHGIYFSFDPLLEQLATQHRTRISTDPDFIYMNERKSQLEEIRAKKTISLKESTRLKEKQKTEEISLSIENKRRKAKSLPLFRNYSDYEKNAEQEDEKRSASAGTTVIDTDNDAVLTEAGYILKDFVNLLNKPSGRVATSH